MPVLLRTSKDLPDAGQYASWLAVTGTSVSLETARKLPQLAERLEAAFYAIRDSWWQIARENSNTPSAVYSYALVCSPVASDFGLMLAWRRLAADLIQEQTNTLVICDDPWLFRQIAEIKDVDAGHPPSLWPAIVRRRIRGMISRFKLFLTLFASAIKTRASKRHHSHGDNCLLVYGHPDSTADGHDAYFGSLMKDLPHIKRLLHTDCPPGRARQLCRDSRSAALHAWGNLLFPVSLLTTKWRPRFNTGDHPFEWLIRRAAELEGSGGAHAMTRWSAHCLENWIRNIRPGSIAWPWENLPWERNLIRLCRQYGVKSIGYQHADVGPHQYNMSPSGNPGGIDELPDIIVLNGPAYRAQLIEWGIPENRLDVGGAHRILPVEKKRHDPNGPVYVALSGLLPIARQMMDAVWNARGNARTFLIKEHPMYPIDFTESENVKRTSKSLSESEGLSAVLYSTGLSGLEAMLAGIPTYRLMMEDRVSLNTLPDGLSAIPVTANSLKSALAKQQSLPDIQWQDLFSPVDNNLWREILSNKPHQGHNLDAQ